MRDTTRYEISHKEVRAEIEDTRKYEIPRSKRYHEIRDITEEIDMPRRRKRPQSKRYHEIRDITEEVDMPSSTRYEASRSAR